jgi:hypothetical protein
MMIIHLNKLALITFAIIGSVLSLLSFCTARRIYVLENRPPEIKEVPVRVEVFKPCPPPPECTPTPVPPFYVSLTPKRNWYSSGNFQAAYLVTIPFDNLWYDSKIPVAPGTKMLWNYESGYSGGLTIVIGSVLNLTENLPRDEKAFFEYEFIAPTTESNDQQQNVFLLDSKRTVQFKALERDLVIVVELFGE